MAATVAVALWAERALEDEVFGKVALMFGLLFVLGAASCAAGIALWSSPMWVNYKGK